MPAQLSKNKSIDEKDECFTACASLQEQKSSMGCGCRLKLGENGVVQIETSGFELLAAHIKFDLSSASTCLTGQRQSFPPRPQFTSHTNFKMSKRGYVRSDSIGLDCALHIAISAEVC
jgi:hypothetical protein